MDKLAYPVVDERVLAPVVPKKFFGKGVRRSPSEVPVPMAGHCLVYRTGEQYTLDSTNLPLDSPTVVEATHVSVVDTTANTEVPVEIPVPSKDGSFFTMRVTFLCTVDDVLEVVRAGGLSAVHALAGYLRGHQRIFEIGLDFGIDEINEVRRKLSAQVHAYATISVPVLKGMTASLTSVEVSTPEEVAVFLGKMRATHHDNVLRTSELTNSELLDDIKAQHQQLREQRSGRHTRRMDAEQKDHEREQVHRIADAVGSDPIAALTLAYTSGEITAKDFADRAAAIREQEIAQDREDMRDRIQHDRRRESLRWEAEREDLRSEWEARRLAIEEERRELAARNDFDRERQRQQWDAERQDLTAHTDFDRQRELRQWDAEREDLRSQWEARRLAVEEERRELAARNDFDRERQRQQWDAERQDLTAHTDFDRQRELRQWDAEREDLKSQWEARRLAIEEERREIAARNDFERERERRRLDAEREDTRYLQDMQRRRELDNAEAQRDYDREDERRRWEAERADRRQEAEWAREDRQLARETDFKEVEAKLDVLRELAKHGQLDMLNLRLDKFVNDMLSHRGTPEIESETPAEQPAITTSNDAETAEKESELDEAEERNTKVEA